MAYLTPEQERINRAHNAHQVAPKYLRYDPDCPECQRQRNWQPPTRECNWCTARLPLNDNNAAIAHNEYHMSHPESITK